MYRNGTTQGISDADLKSHLSSLPSPPSDPTATVEKLLLSRVIAPITGAPTPSYRLTDDARPAELPTGKPLNCHIEWYGDARSAVDVSGDLRGRILELYDAYLAPDGKAVDYDGMKGDERFDAYVDATVELNKVDVSQLSRDGVLLPAFPRPSSPGLICPASAWPVRAPQAAVSSRARPVQRRSRSSSTSTTRSSCTAR